MARLTYKIVSMSTTPVSREHLDIRIEVARARNYKKLSQG